MQDSSKAESRRGGRHILVVEDHADTLRALVRLLAAQGHAVTGAGTWGAATALIGDASRAYDVLIADLGLPDGDGCDVVRAFRAAHSGAGVIVLSGCGMPDEVQRAELAGADLVLVKPAGVVEIRAAIAKLTGSAGA